MGVRGLSTFIARNADEYFTKYELHDTYVVLDGYCIAHHLYKWHSKCNDCFGGDYDKYAHTVYKFFALLQECNVTPLVIFDGGYEDRKLKTVYDRMVQRIRLGNSLNSVTEGGVKMFPLFVRELFKDIILRLKVKAAKCDFEGDQEIACVARALGCPVLSYDSDFYLFDVAYIPFSTVEMQISKNKEKIKFLPCKIYRIDKFLKSFGGLDKSNLPLLGVLLGNDYIKRSAFNDFYQRIKLAKRKNMRSEQQRRIFAVVNWLKHESFESAVKKILWRMETKKRRFIARRIKQIAKGYACTDSEIMKYFGISSKDVNSEIDAITSTIDKITETDDVLQEMDDVSDHDDGNDTKGSSIDDSDDGGTCISEEEDYMEETQWGNITVPEWFFVNFRQCKYPSSFMDILFRNTYYFTPQVENYKLPCSHEISLDIVAAIHGILKSNSSKNLCYLSREGQTSIKKYFLHPSPHTLPAFNDLITMNISQRKNVLFKVLNVDSKLSTIINYFPPLWQLYILSIQYWFANAKPQILNYHVYALLLCGIVLQHCDKQLGFHRSTKKFLDKYEKKIKSLPPTENTFNTSNDTVAPLDNITFNDALNCMHILIEYFQLDYRMRANTKLFDISIVHPFAQFQSCLLHINHLNALLNCPFESTVISDFYDGTFLYNACTNFAKRNCMEAYVKTFLKNCPSVLNSLLCIVKKLDSVLNVNVHVTSVGKRRRKRRNKKKNVDQQEESNSEQNDSSDTGVYDENNRFSVLFANKCVL